MGVSKNSGTPKSSILIGFSIISHPFWGTTIFGNTHMIIYPKPQVFFKLAHECMCCLFEKTMTRFFFPDFFEPKKAGSRG